MPKIPAHCFRADPSTAVSSPVAYHIPLHVPHRVCRDSNGDVYLQPLGRTFKPTDRLPRVQILRGGDTRPMPVGATVAFRPTQVPANGCHATQSASRQVRYPFVLLQGHFLNLFQSQRRGVHAVELVSEPRQHPHRAPSHAHQRAGGQTQATYLPRGFRFALPKEQDPATSGASVQSEPTLLSDECAQALSQFAIAFLRDPESALI